MTVCRVQIRYADLDTQGHVNNTAQLQYVEVARTRRYLEAGLSWQPRQVVRSNQIDYLKPIPVTMESVEVDLQITAVGRTSHTVTFTIRDAAGTVFSTGRSVVVTVDDHGRAAPIPDVLRGSLLPVCTESDT